MFPEGKPDSGDEGGLGSSPGSPAAAPVAPGRTFGLQHLHFFIGKTGAIPVSGVSCLDGCGSVTGIKGVRVCPINQWNGTAAEHCAFTSFLLMEQG